MMFLLAASALTLASALQSPLSPTLIRAEETARASCVIILEKGSKPSGMAICVTKNKLFIAPQSIANRKRVVGLTQLGAKLEFKRLSTDHVSGLTVLSVIGNNAKGVLPVTLAPQDFHRGEQALLVLPNEAVRATISGDNEMAYNLSNKSAIPLDQVQLMTSIQNLQSGFLFDTQGRLEGLLKASLPIQETITGQISNFSAVSMQQAKVQVYGPQRLIIAYSPTSTYFSRIVQGLVSPNHHVPHPMLGLECRAVPNDRGALVVNVYTGSPADKAGLEVGDVITEFGHHPVRNPVDYLRALIDQPIGQPVGITVNRQGEVLTLHAVLIDGSATKQPAQKFPQPTGRFGRH